MLLPSRTIPASNANSSMPAATIKLMLVPRVSLPIWWIESDARNRLIYPLAFDFVGRFA
jgi:hypothetical protein